MKFSYLPFCLFLFAACNFGNKQPQQVASTPVIDTPKVAVDTTMNFPEIAAIPSGDHFPGSLSSLGICHPEEFKSADTASKWYAIYRTDSNYYYTSILLQFSRVDDPVLEGEKGWQIDAPNTKDSVISLVNAVPALQEGIIPAISLRNTTLKPGDTIAFKFNGADYKLYATGNTVKRPGDETIYHYRLFLVGMKDGGQITQLLVQHSYLDDSIPEIMLAGDMDGDGFPDILMNTTYHYNLYRPTLFLSSGRSKTELLHVVAMNDFVGC
ncbi:hypothetical protein ACE38W_13250 [Chitinophaga sp. Hz27]|uniref:hypothetical protein n=1 Tax=Chitinophaga sp. Hz27 TaxID=3347169 RepID=UPI0035DBDB19